MLAKALALTGLVIVGSHPAVFGVTVAVSSQVRGVYQIFAVFDGGATQVQLTHSRVDAVHPAYGPDGRVIAYFAQAQDGSSQIRLMGADGSGDHAVTTPTDPPVNLIPRWSHDGAKIFYTSGAPGPAGKPMLHIWVMQADGTQKQQVTFGDFVDFAPAPAPDGAIAFSSNRSGHFEIWSMAADGSNPVQLTHSTTDATTGYPIEQKVPAWSPDGVKIAYWNGIEMDYLSAAVRSGGTPTVTDWAIFHSWHIWLMDADGGNQHELTQGDDPAWSPDSTMVLHPTLPIYGSNPQPTGPGEPIGVGVTNIDGTGRRVLFTVPPPGPSGFSWQPVQPVPVPSSSIPMLPQWALAVMMGTLLGIGWLVIAGRLATR